MSPHNFTITNYWSIQRGSSIGIQGVTCGANVNVYCSIRVVKVIAYACDTYWDFWCSWLLLLLQGEELLKEKCFPFSFFWLPEVLTVIIGVIVGTAAAAEAGFGIVVYRYRAQHPYTRMWTHTYIYASGSTYSRWYLPWYDWQSRSLVDVNKRINTRDDSLRVWHVQGFQLQLASAPLRCPH